MLFIRTIYCLNSIFLPYAHVAMNYIAIFINVIFYTKRRHFALCQPDTKSVGGGVKAPEGEETAFSYSSQDENRYDNKRTVLLY